MSKSHLFKGFALGAAALCLGFAVGVQVLPAALSTPSEIHPEGEHGILRMGPFDAQTFDSAIAVQVGSEGELKLAADHQASGSGNFARTGSVELAKVSPGTPFDSLFIGLDETSDAGSDVRVQVRVFEPSGAVSAWRTVERESELSLERPASDVQVRLVLNSYSGRVTPRVRSVVIQAVMRVPEADSGEQGVAANLPAPEIISRQLWGARPPKGSYVEHTPDQLTVHHSSQPTQANFIGAASIRGIQAFHQGPERGWIDIGYHFVVAPDGKIYEGRPSNVVGAHSPNNTGKIGICNIGDFQNNEQPTPAQRASLVKLLSYLAGKYKIPASRIFPHRNFQQTDCPGQAMVDLLPGIKTEVAANVAAGK